VQRLRRKRDVEPGLNRTDEPPETVTVRGGNVACAQKHRRTLALAMICSLLASVSPLYTTLITSGSVRCINAIAVQRTRSPPPPELLFAFPPICEHALERVHRATHQYG
jgi:hypothetical protein